MITYYEPITYTVQPEDEGMLLKTILQRRLGVSRKLMSKLKLTEQGIQLNGERVYISVKVRRGDLVELRMEKETSTDILPENIPFDILYEDEHLLVVNKQAGIIVHPTHGHYTGTLANGVVHYWAQKGEQVRFRPVHRLDQETSGVLCIAKNPYIHQHISEQMIAGTVDKYYTAVVFGHPVPSKGVVDEPIDRDPNEPHRRIVTTDGYAARTLYQVETAYEWASKVRIKLESGRTHQIRVHMKHLGCPLIGDSFYGQASPDWTAASTERLALAHTWIERQALHASELVIVHPITGHSVRFTAPLPEDIQRLDQKLKTTMNRNNEEI
ncbi:RluA family pseudouridine synthase [Paenibacillus urinalis]|uniref:Pseudouridine synthase n=1 Tax=Paenibacillus urinalis TaxID=521520 RepID=A0AAX3N3I5_9BACL|nr:MULTISPECIES: RluA family pseudouridine synthase [Paenibacillus]WDH84177.1 RluA family pseudouridine synthase [Paenibacillus urinalis]WDH95620.1 RluA family pseudouridine synthase [Paenibacillus urinalis]WDI03817.1 RluA family pseudouridine synthase [Paenibacillus urinalis]GAK38841.1 RNA pseudouridine synthase [Paenibacillus sp. TCA20]